MLFDTATSLYLSLPLMFTSASTGSLIISGADGRIKGVEALTKAHRAAAGQRMAGGHHNPHIHLGKRPDLQFTRGLGIEHDPEIRLAGDQRLLDGY